RRCYRALLRLYPAGFRDEYGAPMEQGFADDWREADGVIAPLMLLIGTVWDVVTTAPALRAREFAQDLKFSFRVYQKHKFATLSALIALALAIGATTGVFSVLNALLQR